MGEIQNPRNRLFATAAILPVANVQISLAYYTQVLGFRVFFLSPDQQYAMLEREGIGLHLSQEPGAPGCRVFFEVESAASLFREFQGRGAHILNAPSAEFEDWGGRFFDLRDPDGHRLDFVEFAA